MPLSTPITRFMGGNDSDFLSKAAMVVTNPRVSDPGILYRRNVSGRETIGSSFGPVVEDPEQPEQPPPHPVRDGCSTAQIRRTTTTAAAMTHSSANAVCQSTVGIIPSFITNEQLPLRVNSHSRQLPATILTKPQ